MFEVWIVLLILFGISLVISSIGFKKFVWFLSVGYGLSIFGCGIALVIIYSITKNINLTGLLASILLIVYGFRLGGFLLIREIKNKSYQKTLKDMSYHLFFQLYSNAQLQYNQRQYSRQIVKKDQI